MIVDWD